MSALPQSLTRNPGYTQVPSRLRSAQPAADQDGFFKAVGEALVLHSKEQAIPSEWNLTYVEEYPKNKMGEFDHAFDAVLYRVVSSKPAGMDRTGNGVIPKGLMRFNAGPHPTMARYHLVAEGWWENTTVEFQILSKSNATANQIAIWFHRFLMQYAHSMKFFMARGVQNFVFAERLEDDTTKDYGQELYRRRLRYSFRLAFLLNSEAKDLESIHVEARALTPGSNAASPVESFDWSIDDGPKPRA